MPNHSSAAPWHPLPCVSPPPSLAEQQGRQGWKELGWRGSPTDAVCALALCDSAPQQSWAARWCKGLVEMLIPEDVLTSGLMGCNDVVLLSNDLAAGRLLLSWELGLFFQSWRPSFKGYGTWSVFSYYREKGKQEGFATASLGRNVARRRLFAWNSSAGGPGQFPSFLEWPLPFQPGRRKWMNGWICATSTAPVSMLSHQTAMCYLRSVIFAALRRWHKVCSLALWQQLALSALWVCVKVRGRSAPGTRVGRCEVSFLPRGSKSCFCRRQPVRRPCLPHSLYRLW